MKARKRGHQLNGNTNSESVAHGHHPYWRRAHRDWRIWFGVVLMLVAMMNYLMTDDLAWQPRIQPQRSSSAVEK